MNIIQILLAGLLGYCIGNIAGKLMWKNKKKSLN